jgi:hypothetical protein
MAELITDLTQNFPLELPTTLLLKMHSNRPRSINTRTGFDKGAVLPPDLSLQPPSGDKHTFMGSLLPCLH